MPITSTALIALIALGAVAAPVVAAVIGARRRPTRLASRALAAAVTVVVAQALAVTALGLVVNREYGFYASWDDALGRHPDADAEITAGDIAADDAGAGSTRTFTIADARAGSAQAIAWLPPGYDAPENARRHFPVLVVLPGYANTVGSTYENLQIGRIATSLIESRRAAPFVVVVAPYQTVQGRDTECTDVAHGAPEFRYLTRTVPAAIRRHVRAAPGTAQWSALGWSTGGYCAAKALYAQPSPWHSAVSVGGYFEALSDSTTGDLFPTRKARIAGSPSELYRRYQMPSTRLLVVASRQDGDSFRSSRRFARLAAADPHVAAMWVPGGGHNYGTYVPHLPDMMEWALSTPPQT